jgi:glycolate oxidase
MDSLCITAVNAYLGEEEYPADAAAVLLVELDGQEKEVSEAMELAAALCQEAGARTVRRAREAEDRARLWQGRKSAISALGRRFPSYYLQDGVVPRSALPAVMRQIGELSERYGLPVANVFHAGDGNLHPLILYQAFDPDQRANPGKIFPTPKSCAESARRRAEAPELAGVDLF